MTELSLPRPSSLQSSRFGAVPYIFTAFISAGLVFLVQPMFARMALPVLGGSSSVWNVTLVCFQAALLAGYIYAHLLVRLKSVLAQVLIHVTLLAAAALVLPLGLTEALGPPDASAPTVWLIAAFSLSIAPPFIAISATAPLIQAWYARSGRDDAGDPYYLYAASNVGSLIGLFAYPLLMEPLLTLAAQGTSWSTGYLVLAVAITLCGLLTWRSGGTLAVPQASANKAQADGAAPSTRQRLTWLALAFLPSSLLVGATTHISTDIASAPFLWAPPLILYIASFVVVFSSAGPGALKIAARWLPIAVAGVLLFLPRNSTMHIGILFSLDLAALFMAAIVCHGMMAETRPAAGRLTEFYLIMSLGGVLGGAFNALIAPIVFNTSFEYPLMLALVLFVRADLFGKPDSKARLMCVAACGLAGVALVMNPLGMEVSENVKSALLLAGFVIVVLTRSDNYVPGIAAAALVVTGLNLPNSVGTNATSDRSFFGVVRTLDFDGHRIMLHGTTLHGSQKLDEPGRPTPLTYYHDATPIGQVFRAWQDAESVGVIGLGVGSVACHLGAEQKAVFFEIDPLVARIASDPERFQFLSKCAPSAPIVIGDGRLTLQDQPEGTFDLLLVDAFSSDSVPAHLLTVEALDIYLSRLSADGVLAIHTSNRHIALAPIVARATARIGVLARVQRFKPDPSLLEQVTASELILIARDETALDRIADDTRWIELVSDGKRAWTDDYTNIVGALIASRHAEK